MAAFPIDGWQGDLNQLRSIPSFPAFSLEGVEGEDSKPSPKPMGSALWLSQR